MTSELTLENFGGSTWSNWIPAMIKLKRTEATVTILRRKTIYADN